MGAMGQAVMKPPGYAKSRALLIQSFSKRQRTLARKHGLPSEFAAACYQAVPEFISMDEAATAIKKYNLEWSQSK